MTVSLGHCPSFLTLLAVTSMCYGVKVIDLTHQLKEGESITWPDNPMFNFTILLRQHYPLFKNVWVENNKFSASEHVGTHLDAPSHFRKGRWRMHQVPVDRLVGEGVVIDVKAKVKDDMYGVTVEDFEEWEEEHGRIPDNAVVLINSGWARRYPNWKQVFGTTNLKDHKTYHFPTVTGEAARWLAAERDILALGVDTPTPDLDRDYNFPVHQILLGRDILIIENVANLDSLPPTGTTIVLGALNIYDGSGAPMRMMALSGGCRSGPSAVSLAAALSVGLTMLTALLQLH